ncbi:MAG: anthranilate phosphoribosyltransferase [Candidatus Omnitrophota bacterium]
MIKEAIAKLIEKQNLNQYEMSGVMEEIMNGFVTQAQIASFLTALRTKGETVEEITASAEVMRKHVKKIKTKKEVILDTCGTGGDRKGTFNISSAAAFVAAGAGITVAKHGNRSVSSFCGSADLLEGLGINININEEKLTYCLDEIGIGFLFAAQLHPAMKYAAPVRQEIGIRTMFNLLGPLTNPANATHQLVGVYDERLTEMVAQVLGNLGTRHTLVIHGLDGLDEVTTTTQTIVSEFQNNKIKTYKINPVRLGFKKASIEDLKGGSVTENVEIIKDILTGKSGPQRDIVLLNAGCAIYAADKARSIKEGIGLAIQSIDTGKAYEKLELLKEYSNK